MIDWMGIAIAALVAGFMTILGGAMYFEHIDERDGRQQCIEQQMQWVEGSCVR